MLCRCLTSDDNILTTLSHGKFRISDYTNRIDTSDENVKVLIAEGIRYYDVYDVVHNYQAALALSKLDMSTPDIYIWRGHMDPDSEETISIFISGPGGRKGVNEMSKDLLTRQLYSTDPIDLYGPLNIHLIGVPLMGLRYGIDDSIDDILISFYNEEYHLIPEISYQRTSPYKFLDMYLPFEIPLDRIFDMDIPYTVYIVRGTRNEYNITLDPGQDQIVGTYRVKGVISVKSLSNMNKLIQHITPNIIEPYVIRPISQFSDVDIMFNR